jgi:glycosyltransferase involved in cell wall biosynthesis
MCAVVPAHNEEDFIDRCLTALTNAARLLRTHHPRVRSRIVVVADTCTDDTARITATYPGVDALSLHARSVGAARAEGVDLALQTFRHDPEFEPTGSTGWIRNTDADSAVPDNWFLAQFEFAQSGPDVIVGTVRPDFSDLTPQQIRAWKLRHTPSSANGHIHGANLGVRAPAYIAAGGFHADPKHEDLHLVSERLVALLMSQANFVGLPGPAKVKRLHGVATADDLVHRKFHRLAPNKLHHGASDARREGLLLRRDTHVLAEDRRLVDRRRPRHAPRGQCPRHGHQGPQTRCRQHPSRRPWHAVHVVGVHEQDEGRRADVLVRHDQRLLRQLELLNRKKWRTRVDLANAMFKYIEIFYNRQRRHSKLGYITPIAHELRFGKTLIPA